MLGSTTANIDIHLFIYLYITEQPYNLSLCVCVSASGRVREIDGVDTVGMALSWIQWHVVH